MINSVSFTDGLKFHDCRDTYRLLREASDSIDRIMGRSGLEKLYLRYCYELGYLPKYRQNPAKLHILLKEDIREITAEIRGLRNELKVCGEVQERSGHIREILKVIDRDREKERD